MDLFSHDAAIIGIDWADRKHDLCLRLADAPDTFTVLDHAPDAIDAWAEAKRREAFFADAERRARDLPDAQRERAI